MTTRREFIRGAAASGLVFCACGPIDLVYAQGSHKHPNLGSRRKPVIINGRRVRTIDVHSHCLFRDAVALMGADAKSVEPPVKGAPEHYIPVRSEEHTSALQSQSNLVC